MTGEELHLYLEKKEKELNKEKYNIKKKETIETLTLAGIISLLFVGDAKQIIEIESYRPIALMFDALLGIGALSIGTYVIKNTNNKETLKITKEKLELISKIKKDLENGINNYEQLSISSYERLFDLIYLMAYHPEILNEDIINNNIFANNAEIEMKNKAFSLIRK